MTDRSPDDGNQGAADAASGAPEDPSGPLEPDPNALDASELAYPTLSFPDGVGPDGSLDCSQEVDRESLASMLHDLADALASHDVAVEGDDYRATYGFGPAGVDLAFDPDETHRGEIALTVRLNAKVMGVEDADARPVGARGGRGFIPLAMLTEDREPDAYRCYNWIDDPVADMADGEESSTTDS